MVSGTASSNGSHSVAPAASGASSGLASHVTAAVSLGGSTLCGGLGGKSRQPSGSPTDKSRGNKRSKLNDTSYYTVWLLDVLQGMDMSNEEQSTEAALDTGLTVWYKDESAPDCIARWKNIVSLNRGMLEPRLFRIRAINTRDDRYE